jgi:hypothetical protein
MFDNKAEFKKLARLAEEQGNKAAQEAIASAEQNAIETLGDIDTPRFWQIAYDGLCETDSFVLEHSWFLDNGYCF